MVWAISYHYTETKKTGIKEVNGRKKVCCEIKGKKEISKEKRGSEEGEKREHCNFGNYSFTENVKGKKTFKSYILCKKAVYKNYLAKILTLLTETAGRN